MLIMLFSYNFGDRQTDEKAQILIPEYEKIDCYKISYYGKNSDFAIFILLLL